MNTMARLPSDTRAAPASAGHRQTAREEEAPAQVLALILAAQGRWRPQEVAVLRALEAFDRLGVSEERVAAMADGFAQEYWDAGHSSWIPEQLEQHMDLLLDAVSEPRHRNLVCALATAALGGASARQVCGPQVLEHALARWHIDPSLLERGARQP